MKPIPGLFLLSLILTACSKPDDILPGGQHQLDTAVVVAATKVKQDSIAADKDTIVNNSIKKDSTLVKTDSVRQDSTVLTDTVHTKETKAPLIDQPNYLAKKFLDLPYRILIPKNYDPSKSYPILIFLHGIGERGNDNEKQLLWGSSLFQVESIRNKYPAFIVFPQCKTSEYWSNEWGTSSLKGLIEDLKSAYNIDRKRIYVGGLSMGAYGTYAVTAQYPDLFAAAIAISGDGDERKSPAMTKPKWRIFAGKKDNVVSWTKSDKMAKALDHAGASVSFTIYPDADHTESWVRAFAEPDFCSWLFAIAKK